MRGDYLEANSSNTLWYLHEYISANNGIMEISNVLVELAFNEFLAPNSDVIALCVWPNMSDYALTNAYVE